MTDLDQDHPHPDPVPPPTPMIGVVVVTHGMLATELVNAAETIVGDLPHFVAVSIGWHDDGEVAKEAIGTAIAKVERPSGVILLTDMFGGTPANLGMTFLQRDRVEVITGVNLPMLIKLASLRQSSNLIDVARQIGEAGRNAIWVPSDLMRTSTGAGPGSGSGSGSGSGTGSGSGSGPAPGGPGTGAGSGGNGTSSTPADGPNGTPGGPRPGLS